MMHAVVRSLLALTVVANSAHGGLILPPPWADPGVNPCASQPGGWQLVRWPADGRCYKIFQFTADGRRGRPSARPRCPFVYRESGCQQVGPPCPESMELTVTAGRSPRAECACPPGTALGNEDSRCHPLFGNAPCEPGQYFAPDRNETKTRRGSCRRADACPSAADVFWPTDGKCYARYSRGPCPNGRLLTVDVGSGLATCRCAKDRELETYYWETDGTCHQHYTRGPCQEKGYLFLPRGRCDCHPGLAQYHLETGQCYELGTAGPCEQGHEWRLDEKEEDGGRAKCACKEGHVPWSADGRCYRPFTRGPCHQTHVLVNTTSCVPQPCGRGNLYFPEQQTCYRVGSRGPCPTGQVVTFDFRTRPSVDGISYNGMCSCSGPYKQSGRCLKEKRSARECGGGTGMYEGRCHELYAQGPCPLGLWLVPDARHKMRTEDDRTGAKCDCKPGYSKTFESDTGSFRCLPPAFNLANYLNENFVSVSN